MFHIGKLNFRIIVNERGGINVEYTCGEGEVKSSDIVHEIECDDVLWNIFVFRERNLGKSFTEITSEFIEPCNAPLEILGTLSYLEEVSNLIYARALLTDISSREKVYKEVERHCC